MDRQQLLSRLQSRWTAFTGAWAGLPEDAATAHPVVGDWSLKDVLAHVTTWEGEALKALPLVIEGKRTPRYRGIDRFNAEQSARKRDLTLDEVHRQLDETHRRLLDLLERAPETYFATETRFRHRLRLDTYGHYPEHTAAIVDWRRSHGW